MTECWCGKRWYKTKREATLALQQMRERGVIAQGRIYIAHGGWHITSSPFKRNGRLGRATGTLSTDPKMREIMARIKADQHE